MGLRRPRVIIVEDDPDVLMMLRLNLEAAGFDTSLAADGSTAMRRIEAERPDLVVLDLMLPLMDGWSVLAELRDRPGAPKVLVCSARTQQVDRDRAYEMGAAAFVPKPFDVEDLVERAWQLVAPVPDTIPEPPIEGIEGIEPA